MSRFKLNQTKLYKMKNNIDKRGINLHVQNVQSKFYILYVSQPASQPTRYRSRHFKFDAYFQHEDLGIFRHTSSWTDTKIRKY